MNTILEYEILSAIDNIDSCVMEAEMHVLTALCNEYEKSAVILENYEGEDLSCFDIFQEGFKDSLSADKGILGNKSENIFLRILMVIPRLIAALVRKIKQSFDNVKLKKTIAGLKRMNIDRGSKSQKQTNADVSTSSSSESDSSKQVINEAEKMVGFPFDTDDFINTYQGILDIFKSLDGFDIHHPSTANDAINKVTKFANIKKPNFDGETLTFLSPEDAVAFLEKKHGLCLELVSKGESLIKRLQSSYDDYKKTVLSKAGNDESKINTNQKQKLNELTALMNNVKEIYAIISDMENKAHSFIDQAYDQLVQMGYIEKKQNGGE